MVLQHPFAMLSFSTSFVAYLTGLLIQAQQLAWRINEKFWCMKPLNQEPSQCLGLVEQTYPFMAEETPQSLQRYSITSTLLIIKSRSKGRRVTTSLKKSKISLEKGLIYFRLELQRKQALNSPFIGNKCSFYDNKKLTLTGERPAKTMYYQNIRSQDVEEFLNTAVI